jgi:hypothetical protein
MIDNPLAVMRNITKKLLLILSLVVLMLSCSNNSKKSIELKANQNEKLNLGINSQIIKIETNPESLLDYIQKVNVDFLNDRIFILSDFNIYIYNSSGKYINKLKVGRGPGEISRVISFSINENSKLIYAIDNSSQICIYNYDGYSISKFDIKNFASCDITVLDDDNVLLLRNHVGLREKYFVGRYNFSENRIVEKYISSELSPYPMNTVVSYNNFIKCNGKLYFYTPNIFGLFEFVNSDFNRLFSLDLGKKSVPKSLSKKFKKQNPCEMGSEARLQHYIPYILYSFPFKDYYFIIADDNEINCYAICMNTIEVYKNGRLSGYFNLPDIKSLKTPCGIQDDKIIFSCSSADFFESNEDETAKEVMIAGKNITIRIDDNPFVVIIQ